MPNGFYVYCHPLSIPPFVVSPPIGNEKPPWAAFAQEGVQEHLLVPSDARLSWESTPGPWVPLPLEPLDSAMSATLLSWKFAICQQE
jgi:hypothetical protein